jgi:hypothetical protein
VQGLALLPVVPERNLGTVTWPPKIAAIPAPPSRGPARRSGVKNEQRLSEDALRFRAKVGGVEKPFWKRAMSTVSGPARARAV